MGDSRQPLDLSVLEAEYNIVGEVGGVRNARAFTAERKDRSSKRRDDETGVLIEVVEPLEGDEGNAVSHLAADVKALTGQAHRRLVPIIEGRWLGTYAFSVVRQRLSDSTLEQRLATGEKFSNPRAAAILREINGLLEWARERAIVHRAVTPDRIYLEPRTDRVRVAFAVTPIPRVQQVDPVDADARTIGRLAMAMMVGQADPAAYEGQTLAQLRPDLPKELLAATDVVLDPKARGFDVPSYIALVGMADPLFAGESEADRIRAEVLEEQRVERAKLADERAAFDQHMEQEHATLADERSAFERTMEEERADFDRLMEQERAKLASERAALQQAAEVERASVVAKREELERAVAKRLAEIDAAAAADRARIEQLRAEIQHAGEQEVEKKRLAALEDIEDDDTPLDGEEYATPSFMLPVIEPIEPVVFSEESEIERVPESEVVLASIPEPEQGMGLTSASGAPASTPTARRRWIIPAGIAGAIAVAGVAAALVAGRTSPTPVPAQVVARPAAVVPAPVPLAPSAVPLPTGVITIDTMSTAVVAHRDSVRRRALAAAAAAKARPKPKPVIHDAQWRADSAAAASIGGQVPGFTPAREPTPPPGSARPDSAPKKPAGTPRDSTG